MEEVNFVITSCFSNLNTGTYSSSLQLLRHYLTLPSITRNEKRDLLEKFSVEQRSNGQTVKNVPHVDSYRKLKIQRLVGKNS
jgi:hypothetical protein